MAIVVAAQAVGQMALSVGYHEPFLIIYVYICTNPFAKT